MEVYLVGGAVRDDLLGLAIKERDWCVVGATPDDLIQLGYRPVGKDFPVFLHPKTGEEYALARTERKTAAGYHGFTFHASPEISIEEDLGRRDLTINAIARGPDEQLIDPFSGQQDLIDKQLRHVSEAFTEDPVRILRVARFAARFHHLGFVVAADTLQLMREMVQQGEAGALVPERVWKETETALGEANPEVYFEVLRNCGALAVIFPEIEALFGVPQPEKWHPEIDCGVHALMALQQAVKLSDSIDVRFAALTHDLGKATTDKQKLPSHPGHEARSAKLVRKMAKRLSVPNGCRDLAAISAEYHTHCHRVFDLRASTLLKVFERTDAFRRPERFEKFVLVCEADARGRTGLEERDYPQSAFILDAVEAAGSVKTDDIATGDLTGPAIGKEIHARRLAAIHEFKKSYDPPK